MCFFLCDYCTIKVCPFIEKKKKKMIDDVKEVGPWEIKEKEKKKRKMLKRETTVSVMFGRQMGLRIFNLGQNTYLVIIFISYFNLISNF